MGEDRDPTALQMARETERLSCEQVGRLIDPPVSGRTVKRWEKGEASLDYWRLRQLAQVYRVPVDELARLMQVQRGARE